MFNTGYNYSQNPYQNPYQRLENQMQQYPQQQQQMPLQSTPNQYSYVNGKEGAKAWILSPNSKILLMDSDDDRFFLKQTDANGMATIDTYTFSKMTETRSEKQTNNEESYLTKKEFQDYKAEIDKFKDEFTELFNPPAKKKVIIDG